MKARARRLLAALEDGCQTRSEIFSHQGRFSLLNNAAAELRDAGISVDCRIVDGDYTYSLGEGTAVPPAGGTASPPEQAAPLAENTQLALVAA